MKIPSTPSAAATRRVPGAGSTGDPLAQRFRVPSSLARVEFSTTEVSLLTADQVRQAGPTQHMLSGLERIRAKAGPALDDVEVVVYPFIGNDGGWPSAVLGRAPRVTIGLDDHPFWKRRHGSGSPRLSAVPAQIKAWTFYDDVGDDSGAAGKILGKLQSHVIGFRLRKVEAIEDGSKTHGLVEFDTGPGSKVCQYVHLHEALDARDYRGAWWLDEVLRLKPRLLLLKGANGSPFQEGGAGEKLRQPFLCALRDNGGAVIEEGTSRGGRFSGNELLEGNRSSALVIAQWGYGDLVRLTTF